MTRDVDRSPIKVPEAFGAEVAAYLTGGIAAKVETDTFPFADLPVECVTELYEAPGLTVARIAQHSEGPDGGAWALLAPPALDRLAVRVADGKATVEFMGEGERFRKALADHYYSPGEGDE